MKNTNTELKPSLILTNEELRINDTIVYSLRLCFTPAQTRFLQKLHYWLQRGKGQWWDGRKWIHNTYDDWARELNYSPDGIGTAVSALKKTGVIETQRLDQYNWNSTNHYTIDYDRLWEYVEDNYINFISTKGIFALIKKGADFIKFNWENSQLRETCQKAFLEFLKVAEDKDIATLIRVNFSASMELFCEEAKTLFVGRLETIKKYLSQKFKMKYPKYLQFSKGLLKGHIAPTTIEIPEVKTPAVEMEIKEENKPMIEVPTVEQTSVNLNSTRQKKPDPYWDNKRVRNVQEKSPLSVVDYHTGEVKFPDGPWLVEGKLNYNFIEWIAEKWEKKYSDEKSIDAHVKNVILHFTKNPINIISAWEEYHNFFSKKLKNWTLRANHGDKLREGEEQILTKHYRAIEPVPEELQIVQKENEKTVQDAYTYIAQKANIQHQPAKITPVVEVLTVEVSLSSKEVKEVNTSMDCDQQTLTETKKEKQPFKDLFTNFMEKFNKEEQAKGNPPVEKLSSAWIQQSFRLGRYKELVKEVCENLEYDYTNGNDLKILNQILGYQQPMVNNNVHLKHFITAQYKNKGYRINYAYNMITSIEEPDF